MSYRCERCTTIVPPGTARLMWQVTRPDGNIDKEIPICRACQIALHAGAPVQIIITEEMKREREEALKPEVVVISRPKAERVD